MIFYLKDKCNFSYRRIYENEIRGENVATKKENESRRKKIIPEKAAMNGNLVLKNITFICL